MTSVFYEGIEHKVRGNLLDLSGKNISEIEEIEELNKLKELETLNLSQKVLEK
jgi:Leucine-rich repeat (LRR) protein